MDYVLYRNLFRKSLRNNRINHCDIPALNLQNPEFVASGDFYVNVPANTELGYDFGSYNVLVVGEERKDLAIDLIERKNLWTKKMRKLQPKEKRDALRELRRFHDDVQQNMSVRLRRYIEHIASDPIPGFEGNRNWLYSGGTVTSFNNDDASSGHSLISCCDSGLSTIEKLDLNDDSEIQNRSSLPMKMKEPILQLSADPLTSLVMVRQKNNLTILEEDNKRFLVKLKKKIRHSNFFTSAALRGGKVAIAKNLGGVALFDVQVNQLSFVIPPTDGQLPCAARNYWSQVNWRDDGLWVLRKKMLTHIDPRDNSQKWNMNESLEDCEEFCNYFESDCDAENSNYFATNHSLLQVDVRQRKFVHKWSHLMRHPPTFGQAVKTGTNEELVVLQSSNPRDSVVVANGIEKWHIPPRLVSGPPDALHEAQLQGICLDPEASKRAGYTVTGTHVFPCGDKLRQVTQNAGGDIFIRDITKKDTMDTEDNTNKFKQSWTELEEDAPTNNHCHYSEMVDMTKAFDLLRIPHVETASAAEPLVWALSEDLVPEELAQYKDELVQPILEAWNVEQKVCEEDEEEMVDDVVPSELKVEEWLRRHVDS